MSRPGHDLTAKHLLRKASAQQNRESDLSQPTSVNSQDNRKNETIVNYDDERAHMQAPANDKTECSLKLSDVQAVMNELRYITNKIKEDDKKEEETNDWKWAAMIIDRLCFWIFAAYLLIGTMVLFYRIPRFT